MCSVTSYWACRIIRNRTSRMWCWQNIQRCNCFQCRFEKIANTVHVHSSNAVCNNTRVNRKLYLWNLRLFYFNGEYCFRLDCVIMTTGSIDIRASCERDSFRKSILYNGVSLGECISILKPLSWSQAYSTFVFSWRNCRNTDSAYRPPLQWNGNISVSGLL